MAILNKNAPIARPTRELCVMACCFCRDRQFWAWIRELDGTGFDFDERDAKSFILIVCGVKSRNELDTNPEAAKLFHDQVRTPFLAWKEVQG